MKIAILGAGYAGISLAWYLCNYTLGLARIDIFDPNPVAMGASRISLGILNPYMGKRAKKIWQPNRCVREVHRLITEASHVARYPVVIQKGVLRPASTEDQMEDFKARAIEFNDVQWWEKEECESKISNLHIPDGGGGLYIPDAVSINIPMYLKGLWVGIARFSAVYRKLTMLDKDTLQQYDRIIVCLGANTLDFGALKALPMTRVKGHILELAWPQDLDPLPMSLSGEGQIVMGPDYKSCLVGSTYEREFKDFNAHPEWAKEEIMKKITPFYPALKDAHVLGCRARMRGSSKTRLPLLGQVNERVWFYTGLGSKGLLYHAYCSKIMAQAILDNNPSIIPQELLHTMNLPQQQS